jgi:lysozyme
MANKPKIAGLSAAGIAALFALASHWEGQKTVAYQDIVGVWTVCSGETRGVKKGDTYTPAQCNDMLKKAVAQYDTALLPCIKQELTQGQRVALADLAYNVGTGAVCKSTALRLMNEGKKVEGCAALLNWSYAGGKQIQGLLNRRKDDQKICLS